MPTFDHLRPGHTQPQEEPAAAQLVEGRRGHRRHRRRAGMHLEDGRSDMDSVGLGRDPAEHGYRVGSIGLGGPDRVVVEALGFLDQVERAPHPGTPVADVEP